MVCHAIQKQLSRRFLRVFLNLESLQILNALRSLIFLLSTRVTCVRLLDIPKYTFYAFFKGDFRPGPVDDYHLQGLSLKLGNSWQALAWRLGFKKADIDGFNNSKETYTEKQLAMLQEWKQKHGSDATYEVLGTPCVTNMLGVKIWQKCFV